MLIIVLFADVLLLRLGVTRTSRAVLIIVLFADVLLLRLGVTDTSRAVLIIVLFADVFFLPFFSSCQLGTRNPARN